MYKKTLLLVILAIGMMASKPITCPRGWTRGNATITSTHVKFIAGSNQTIKAVCVNGEKRILRDGAEGLNVMFQLSELTGFVVFDAAWKVK